MAQTQAQGPVQQPVLDHMAQTQGQDPDQQPGLTETHLHYQTQVKVRFSEHRDVYDKFLGMLLDVRSRATDFSAVLGRLSTLFAGHPDLIQGFSIFLPREYGMLCDALSYLDRVKVRFSERPGVYDEYMNILKDVNSGETDTSAAIDRMGTLFAGHPDLIQDFSTFLHPSYRIKCYRLSYLDRVRDRWPNEFQELLYIIRNLESGAMETAEVLRRVGMLFEGNQDFIRGFISCLLPSYRT